jgi:uncharacterized protein
VKSKRIVLDTNLWIHFLISKDLKNLDKYIFEGKLIILFSQELLEEFIEVTGRPKFRKYFSLDSITHLLRLFDFYGDYVKTSSQINLCRDNKDNFLLNLAVDGKADFLVSGDVDLLELKMIEKTKIITISELLNIVE